MTSRDRVGLAMNLDVPDRVPVFCQLAIGHYFLNARPSPFDVWFRSGAFANALVELQRRYRFDGILVNLPGRVGQLPNLLFIECPLSSSISASRRLRSNTLTEPSGRDMDILPLDIHYCIITQMPIRGHGVMVSGRLLARRIQVAQCCRRSLNEWLYLRHVDGRCFPHDAQVYNEVVVNQLVTDSCDLTPWDLRMGACEIG